MSVNEAYVRYWIALCSLVGIGLITMAILWAKRVASYVGCLLK